MRAEGEIMLGPGGGRWLRLAQIVSLITNPVYIAPPLYLVIALRTAPTVTQALLWFAVIGVGVSLAPILFIRRGVQRGQYTDHHVSKREQRLLPLLFATGCMALVFVVLIWMKASLALLGTMTAMLLAFGIALVITQVGRWKISLHLLGITGAITTLSVMIGPALLLLAPLILLVGWARWAVRAHTPRQSFDGAVLAIGVTVAVFRAVGLL